MKTIAFLSILLTASAPALSETAETMVFGNDLKVTKCSGTQKCEVMRAPIARSTVSLDTCYGAELCWGESISSVVVDGIQFTERVQVYKKIRPTDYTVLVFLENDRDADISSAMQLNPDSLKSPIKIVGHGLKASGVRYIPEISIGDSNYIP